MSALTTIADADGRIIHEGSVLRHINEPVVGVVDRIFKAGDRVTTTMPVFAGDIRLRLNAGCYRVTNVYANWRHVPHEKQTYAQRYFAWAVSPALPNEDDDELSRMTKDEARAVAGIMALIPEDAVDHAYGPFPDTLEGALEILSRHLAKLCNQED